MYDFWGTGCLHEYALQLALSPLRYSEEGAFLTKFLSPFSRV